MIESAFLVQAASMRLPSASLLPSRSSVTRALVTLLATTTAPTLLSDLSPGQPLQGTVKATFRQKVYFSVPVERVGKAGKLKPVDAYASLPAGSKLPGLGRKFTCYVLKAQPEAGRLSVYLENANEPLPPPDATTWPLKLEELSTGDEIVGKIVNVQPPTGAFVEVEVSRAGPKGSRRPMRTALLPADQLPGTNGLSSIYKGQSLDLRVLQAKPEQGRLLLTALPLDANALKRMLEQRAIAQRLKLSRPSLAALAKTPGAKREGTVIRLEEYGVVVNVGARKAGLIHISQLGRVDGGSSFVKDPSDVCSIGDNVLVQVLPRSNEKRLSLRLLKVFPRDEAEEAEQRATLRGDETLNPTKVRRDDEVLLRSAGGGAAVEELQTAADEDAMWAAREGEEEEEEEEEDPFAWAAAASDESTQGDEDDEEDPWAWAAASSPSTPEPSGGDDAADGDAEEEEGPEWGEQEYFEEKYDVDFY